MHQKWIGSKERQLAKRESILNSRDGSVRIEEARLKARKLNVIEENGQLNKECAALQSRSSEIKSVRREKERELSSVLDSIKKETKNLAKIKRLSEKLEDNQKSLDKQKKQIDKERESQEKQAAYFNMLSLIEEVRQHMNNKDMDNINRSYEGIRKAYALLDIETKSLHYEKIMSLREEISKI